MELCRRRTNCRTRIWCRWCWRAWKMSAERHRANLHYQFLPLIPFSVQPAAGSARGSRQSPPATICRQLGCRQQKRLVQKTKTPAILGRRRLDATAERDRCLGRHIRKVPAMPQQNISTPGFQRLLTPREAAEFLRVSASWLAKARMRGDGPPFSKIGRAVRYPEGCSAPVDEIKRPPFDQRAIMDVTKQVPSCRVR